MRTDFTQEIDGAMAGRNLGMRHFSEIARSGNGNMRTDLTEDLADYRELAGLGETVEEVTNEESAQIDHYGSMARIQQFRWPAPGEVPPYAAKEGSVWLRKRSLTDSRKPGGKRTVKVTWVMVTKLRLLEMRRDGELGAFPTGMTVSLGIGLVVGIGAWLLLRRK
jgi:hypothetical protein